MFLTIARETLTPGTILSVTVGAGGSGGSKGQNLLLPDDDPFGIGHDANNGGDGANGGITSIQDSNGNAILVSGGPGGGGGTAATDTSNGIPGVHQMDWANDICNNSMCNGSVVIWRYGDCANNYGGGSPGGANGGNGGGYVSGTQGGGGTVVIWY